MSSEVTITAKDFCKYLKDELTSHLADGESNGDIILDIGGDDWFTYVDVESQCLWKIGVEKGEVA